MRNYLLLRDRLTQVWLNKYSITVTILTAKIVLFNYFIIRILRYTEKYAISSCNGLDQVNRKVFDDLPIFVNTLGNYMIRKSMLESVEASLRGLEILIDASEGLLSFLVDLYLGTYACLLISAVDGAVDVATNTTEHILEAVNNTLIEATRGLDDGLNDLTSLINKGGNRLSSIFKSDNSVAASLSKVNFTVKGLRNIHLSSKINDQLQYMADKVPSFDDLKSETKDLISIPFYHVKREITKVNAESLLPDTKILYSRNNTDTTLYPICGQYIPNIKKVYEHLIHILKVGNILVAILGIFIALFMAIPSIQKEIQESKRLNNVQDEVSQYIDNKEFMSSGDNSSLNYNPFNDSKFNLAESYQRNFNPIARWMTIKMGKYFGNDETEYSERLQFCMLYIFSSRSSTIMAMGLIGLITVAIQLILIQIISNYLSNTGKVHIQLQASNDEINKMIKSDINLWTSLANQYVNGTEANLNTQVFGWITNTTASVNATVAHAVDKIEYILASSFNNTPLYKPMKTVVGCAILRKLISVENAMTWINNEAHIKLPRINTTELINIAGHTKMLPSSNESHMFDQVEKIVNIARKTALNELYVPLALIGIWLTQIPMALLLSWRRCDTTGKT
ncbi:Plasma membrane fusion protein PRM1 [Nakaseomyces glabratus]|nr:Plasma membrane fusion protein PRM1 [Nakaseomyces glabratus]KTB19713.1 Plasma membrane fusion protein PRM1 [Nakaseomyces glabratus]